MKKIIALLSFALFAYTLSGQCKLDKNEVDPYEGTHEIATETAKVWGLSKQGRFEAALLSSNDLVYFSVIVPVQDVTSVNKGDRAVLLLEDGNKIEITAEASQVANYDIAMGIDFWQIPIVYRLTEEQLNQLKEKPLAGVRFYLANSYREYTLKKKKNQVKVQELAECLLANRPAPAIVKTE